MLQFQRHLEYEAKVNTAHTGSLWFLRQVLVSIQGLVLVPEPYYNEAGYEKQVGTLDGARNALIYNESAFLATARTTLALLRSPPAPFQPLIQACALAPSAVS